MSAIYILLASLLAAATALQFPERHYGCPAGKNVCIYPIDNSQLQCETFFDFQVALHVPSNLSLTNFRQLLDIKFSLPKGEVLTPESLFGKQPELRTWLLEAFEDSADETPVGFTSYAVNYRNVRIPNEKGKGPVNVTVSALGTTTVVNWFVREPTKRRAKNVILFVGDGMALPMMAAARLVSRGMVDGKFKGLLNMEKFPYMALQNPSGIDSIITDSANSATTMNTGQKSSVNALGVYADSSDDDFAHPKQETIAEHIKRRFGMSTGVVTTAEIQDATPAAVWAHVRRRDRKANITAQAINGCLSCVLPVKPEVIMGGGGRYFLPPDSVDGSNMYENYSRNGYTVTHTRAEMLAAAEDPDTKRLLTISHYGNMEVWLDRNVYTDNLKVSENSPTGDGVPPTDQPNLDEMVMSALKILSLNENGFYLMVEAASIDKSAHPLDLPRTLSDLIELDNTVGKVKEWAQEHGDNTLIMATADHGHGFDVFGTVDTKIWDDAVVASEEDPVSDVRHMCSAVRDNAGTLFTIKREETTNMRVRQANRARRTAIGTYAAAGYPDYEDSDGDGFPDTWDVRTVLAAGMNNYPDHTEDYKVSTSIKTPALLTEVGYLNNPEDDPNGIFLTGNVDPFGSTGVHTFQDVGLFAYGPGSERVRGIVDNTEIFHVIASALGFGTNGTIDQDSHLFGDLIRCRNDGKFCHCEEVKGSYMCACQKGGPMAFVLPSTTLCFVREDGTPVSPRPI